jgi:hypothetical protein
MGWIESAGGPLVVIPRSMSGEWKGIAGDDYNEACRVENYLGLVARKWGDILVLGDEPLRTAVVSRSEGPAIVRWMYAPNEDQLLRVAATANLDELRPVETLSVRLLDEPYVIFDSGANGSTAPRLEFTPLPGSHPVNTYVIKDAGHEVGLILHDFGR